MRPLTAFEAKVSEAILAFAEVRRWEFAACLETPGGPLIELRTLMRLDAADPSESVIQRVNQGAAVIVHHNHLSQESLSDADWKGVTNLFCEIFAHCADGTVYWGRAKDKAAITSALARPSLEYDATNLLFPLILNDPDSSSIAMFFRKEVINRAMRICGMVEYEYVWGSAAVPPCGPNAMSRPVHELGTRFDPALDRAAGDLARTF